VHCALQLFIFTALRKIAHGFRCLELGGAAKSAEHGTHFQTAHSLHLEVRVLFAVFFMFPKATFVDIAAWTYGTRNALIAVHAVPLLFFSTTL
jgi:hypothetical protein